MGKLQDGTSIREYLLYFGKDFDINKIDPKTEMKSLQYKFYNSEFTYEAYHKTINDQLWEAKNGFWNLFTRDVGEYLQKLW